VTSSPSAKEFSHCEASENKCILALFVQKPTAESWQRAAAKIFARGLRPR
jgi:hypothetical protein